MKPHFAALAFSIFSLNALADDQSLQSVFYAGGGGGTRGANFSAGGGTKVDALEISSINLGAVSGIGSARFAGISLVQNATPIKGFNFLFRIGLGKETTTFANGATATRMWFGNGVFFGIGERYQMSDHLAFRAEVYRIAYAATPDGSLTRVRYPVTLSALFMF